jgi:hypothetical protein
MSDDVEEILAQERAAVAETREGPERYDPGGHDGPFGYELADLDVVPDSLVDFAEYLADDSQAFADKFTHDVQQNLQEFTTFGAGIEEGNHLQENYFYALLSLIELMQDAGKGIGALAGAAGYVQASYLSGDVSAAATIDNAWDGFDVEMVGMAFGRQERWPAMSENPDADMLEQAERDFAALRNGVGTTLTLPPAVDEDGEEVEQTSRMGAGVTDPALNNAQQRLWDQVAEDINTANDAEVHPFLDESDSPGWPDEEGYEPWGNPYVTDLPPNHPDREFE